MKITKDGRKLFMKALHGRDGEFNTVETHRDEVVMRKKKKMRSFKVVGSLTRIEAAVQKELIKIDKRCCMAITGDVIIENFMDVITEDFMDE